MGLFSKSEFVCEKCGKTFKAWMFSDLCPECKQQEKEEEKRREEEKDREYERAHELIPGYIKLSYDLVNMFDKTTEYISPLENCDAIVAHRDAIVEKYSKSGILPGMLDRARDHYEELSHDQALDIYARCHLNTVIGELKGLYITPYYTMGFKYDGVIIENKDIFAVAYGTDWTVKAGLGSDTVMAYVFTNDPYVPIIVGACIGRIDKGSIYNQSIRDSIKRIFTAYCPNLQYPIVEVEELKKMILEDGCVKGNMDFEFMKSQLGYIDGHKLAFSGTEILQIEEAGPQTNDLALKIGAREQAFIDEYLEDEKCRAFWQAIAAEATAK